MTDTVALFLAIRRLNEFLAENPQAAEMQAKIDALMKGAGNQHNRIVLLNTWMMDSFREMGDALKDLQVSLAPITALAEQISQTSEKE